MKDRGPNKDEGRPTEGLDRAEERAPVDGLSDQQLEAIDLLMEGMKPTAVAGRLGMSREQLWRWRTHSAAFVARLNHVREEVHGGVVDRLRRIVDESLDVIEESLDEGDPQAATDVLKIAARGLLSV